MSIATYTELVSAVSQFSHRSDIASRAPMLITLAEARIKALLDEHVQDVSGVLATTPGVSFVTLPDDLLHVRALTIPGVVQNIEYAPPDQINASFDATVTSAPRLYTVVGNQLQLAPTPDAAYDMQATYTVAVPALTEDAPANALLTRWPNVYLWGVLAEVYKLARNFEMLQLTEADFQTAISSINLLSWKTSGPLRVRSDVRSV